MNRLPTLAPRIAFAAITLSAMSATHAAQPIADCPIPKYMAPLPATISNPVKPWGTTDTGAIVDGFVGLTHPDGILHGIDLSHANVIRDYKVYSRCGGKFAFVKLDSSYPKHLDAIAHENWTTIPYVFFSVPDWLRDARAYASLRSSDTAKIDGALDRFAAIGSQAAAELPQQLQQYSGSQIPKIAFAGLKGRILALDVEQKLTDERNANARLYYGRFYAHAVCTYIDRVKARYPDTMIIIYSTPSVFGDYLNHAYQQDDDCLRGLPVWMARTTRDGGDLIGVVGSKDVNDLYAQRACLQPAGNRCIVHQYSHRGVVGMILPVTKPSVPHVDIDRAFPVKAVSDSKTTQYVRR
jgi:hypothetical protein